MSRYKVTITIDPGKNSNEGVCHIEGTLGEDWHYSDSAYGNSLTLEIEGVNSSSVHYIKDACDNVQKESKTA